MNIFKISTTNYDEEDFFIVANLSKEDIVKVIKPIVQEERFGRDGYNNEDLFDALQSHYPRKKIELYTEFELITI
jgi:hypothetical protein